MRTYAQLTTSFVVFCNRVGVEESISFWGGSEVIAPTGEVVFGAPLYDEGLFIVDIATADIRRERIVLPLLRDERPELQVRELGRIVAERAGMAPDSTADPEEEAVAEPRPIAPTAARRRRLAIRDPSATSDDRPRPSRSSCRSSSRSTPTSPGGSSASSSAASSARPASSGPCVGLSGGIDSALVAYLVAEAIGAERLHAVLHAVPGVVAGIARRRRDGRRGARLLERGGRDHGHGRRLLRDGVDDRRGRTGGPGRERAATRQLRRPDADGRPVRPVGDVRRARRRDRQQDRVADRLHDAVRRLRLRVQPDRRPVQEPGPPAGRRHRRAGRDRAQGADAPTCGRARPTRRRAGSATRSSIGCCSGGSTSGARSTRWSRSGFDPAMVERVDRMVAGAEFKRQVPPIAKLGPRTTGVDYLYPRRRPGSARG